MLTLKTVKHFVSYKKLLMSFVVKCWKPANAVLVSRILNFLKYDKTVQMTSNTKTTKAFQLNENLQKLFETNFILEKAFWIANKSSKVSQSAKNSLKLCSRKKKAC